MGTVIVTAATGREVADLIKLVGGPKAILPGGYEFHEMELGEAALVIAVTGIGKVNTAAAITALIHRYDPALLINTGCCGAYPGSGLSIGDLAAATSEIYGDEGVETPDGWRSLETIGIPVLSHAGVSYFNRLPLSEEIVGQAKSFAAGMGLRLAAGPFVTVSTCSGTLARGVELAGRHGAVFCENMEGAAAAHVALSHGVDFLEVRGVSNFVEDRDISRWDIDLAVANVQRFLVEFVTEYVGRRPGGSTFGS